MAVVIDHRVSVAHRKIQRQIKSWIPEVFLEYPFKNIGRIADVCWLERGIVFEIQCSPLSLDEAKERSEAYLRAGFHPVWILYTRHYGKNRVTPAEEYLRGLGAYYSDGAQIYDQFEVVEERRRLLKGPPLLVDLRRPLPELPRVAEMPRILRERRRVAFEGDLFDAFSQEGGKFWLELEKSAETPSRWGWGRRLAQSARYALLERIFACA